MYLAPAVGYAAGALFLPINSFVIYLIQHMRALGDVVVLTALVRDIKLAYPHIEIFVRTRFPDVWQNNPYVSQNFAPHETPSTACRLIQADYGSGIREDHKKRPLHFLACFHEDFSRKTGLSLSLAEPKPDLHLDEAERTPPVEGRYWVMMAGGKTDIPLKVWSHKYWQRVVDDLRDRGIGVVQAGALGGNHRHEPLANVLDLRGRTNVRDFLRLIAAADGVLCGVTAAMHIAAGLERPCVVIAGGRESWWWEAYVRQNAGLTGAERLRTPHRFLHTIGLLDCCKQHGCFKKKLPEFNHKKAVCLLPTIAEGLPLATCMAMIEPGHALEAVLSYYTDDSLPPIDPRNYKPPEVAATLPSAPEPKIRHARVELPPPIIQTPPAPIVVSTQMIERSRAVSPLDCDSTFFDHPTIGGKFAFCVLLTGAHLATHRACLDSLLNTVPRGRCELRLHCVDLGRESREYVDELMGSGVVKSLQLHNMDPGKYPIMRHEILNTDLPIQSSYMFWVDDDTAFDREPRWLQTFAKAIVGKHDDGFRQFGVRQTFAMTRSQIDWIKASPWYRQVSFHRGMQIEFCHGSFFAVHVPTLRELSAPDERLTQHGDYVLSAMLQQAGYKIHGVMRGREKSLVNWGRYPKRTAMQRRSGR